METNRQYQIQDLHSQYDLSLEQVQTIVNVINAMSLIITRKSTPEQEKNILGELKYDYPKDPRKTITSASFRIPLIGHGGDLNRVNDQQPWSEGGLLIAVDQVPYKMGLTKRFFTEALGLIFDKAIFIERNDAPIPAYHIFYYHKDIGSIRLRYEFDTRPDASNLKDGYPKAFHEVRIYDATVHKK